MKRSPEEVRAALARIRPRTYREDIEGEEAGETEEAEALWARGFLLGEQGKDQHMTYYTDMIERMKELQQENETLRTTLAQIGASVTAALTLPRDTRIYTRTLSDIQHTTAALLPEPEPKHEPCSTIYCFPNNTYGNHITDLQVVAVCSECGEKLAEHQSSKAYALHDIGINSNWKHDAYLKHNAAEHEGKPYALVWIEDPATASHPGFLQLQRLLTSRI